jgi:hypothetical protein
MNAVYPWSDNYDSFRQIINRRFVAFPWLISMATNKCQVEAAMKAAIKYNIPFCMRSGAHSYEPYCIVDGITIDQSQRTKFTINHKTRQVTLEPGVLNGPLADALGKYGLAIAQGTCANVSVTGLCLGGGMGFLGRKYGLGCDNVLSFDIIIADGTLLHVDKDSYPDLFWACRGAGNGNFGIITELTLQAHYVPEVIQFELFWKFDDLYSVLKKYFEWLKHDNGVGIEMDIFPLSREYPILLTGIYSGSRDKLDCYLKPFLNLDHKIVIIKTTTYTDAARTYTYSRFPQPYFKNKSYYAYDVLPPTVVPIFEKYMKMAGPNDRIEFNGLGASYNKNDTAYAHRGARVWIMYIARWGISPNISGKNSKLVPGWEDSVIGPEKIKWVTSLYQEIKDVSGDVIRGAYVGCFDSDITDYLHEYYGDNLQKLKEIKTKYDPSNKFRYPQSL